MDSKSKNFAGFEEALVLSIENGIFVSCANTDGFCVPVEDLEGKSERYPNAVGYRRDTNPI